MVLDSVIIGHVQHYVMDNTLRTDAGSACFTVWLPSEIETNNP
jgi:hypothetical protein